MSTEKPRAWVIGAGLAGLSAAVRLVEKGWPVTILEAAGQAGGRCRSYFDKHLDRRIDNGNHLLLSGNRAAMAFLETVGSRDTMMDVSPAQLPFIDLDSGAQWTLKPNAGPIPWWVFARSRRVPETRITGYLSAIRMARAGDRTIADLFEGAPDTAKRRLYDRFWEPMAVAVLNTEAENGAAKLLWPVMTEILLRGEAAFRPCIARDGLSESFVEPALAWLSERSGDIRFNSRIKSLIRTGDRVTALEVGADAIDISNDDRIVLATTPTVTRGLLPDQIAPDEYRPIVNLHFILDRPVALPGNLPLVGLIGGTAQWLFLRNDILSVTISAGVAEAEMDHEPLASTAWRDICAALRFDHPLPKHRVVTEKRATIAQTPDQEALRPTSQTGLNNLFLAGDWTDTGLPCTIEGAIRSGEQAAALIGRYGELAPSS